MRVCRRSSCVRNLLHGLVEGPSFARRASEGREPEHDHVEVDGVAGEFALGPAPVRRLDEEALVGFDLEIAAAAIAQDQGALLQGDASGSDPDSGH